MGGVRIFTEDKQTLQAFFYFLLKPTKKGSLQLLWEDWGRTIIFSVFGVTLLCSQGWFFFFFRRRGIRSDAWGSVQISGVFGWRNYILEGIMTSVFDTIFRDS